LLCYSIILPAIIQRTYMIAAPHADTTSRTIQVFTLSNPHGMKMTITNYGAKIMSLIVPDKNGNPGDVVLGYDLPQQYLTGGPYYGAVIGRYANRIAKGKFTLEGKEYLLSLNNGENSLHGGPGGFHNVYWKESGPSTKETLQLEYISQDGEEGYPGNLQVKITYSLTENNELILDYSATTDRTTVLNLTNHSFFNLAGEGSGDILGHELMIKADFFMPVDPGLIPTGEKRSVEGTPFDFRQSMKMGDRITDMDEQIRLGKGYDHNWILNKRENSPSLAARVVEQTSGRTMEVFTTEPGLQFYTGNFLDGSDRGKSGKPYSFRSAFCLETQHFPDSPNHPDFPSVVLHQGDTYLQKTIYKFSVGIN